MKPGSSERVQVAMRDLYDRYFLSRDYRRRYPHPNRSTLSFLLKNGAIEARSILDMGCGNGRYAMALLDAGVTRITGCDISAMALREFETRLDGHPHQERVRMVLDRDPMPEHFGQFDLALLMFGVLSHIGDRPARVAMLRRLWHLTTPAAKLLLSVPSIWRRRPLELLASLPQKLRQPAHGESVGDIRFTRHIDGEPHDFFYHLYTLSGLREELSLGGWALMEAGAESLLPEWLVTQSRIAGQIDGWARPLVPSALGYGIRAVAWRQQQQPEERTC